MKKLIPLLAIVVIFSMCKKDKKSSVATVTTIAVTELTSGSAKTGGAIADDGGSAITKKGICWALHASPTVSDSITNEGSGTSSFTSNLSGLMANTTYYVKAYAINGTGTGYGNEVSFTTSKGLPTVTTTAISNNVALSATGGGNVLSDGGYPITARGVVWATSHNPTIANFKTSDGTGTGTFTSTLTPLASQTVYYVRAYATTSFGTAYGNEITLTAASSNSIADIDGNVYTTVVIGTQTWMASNLKTTHYRNGDLITNGLATNFDWQGAIDANTADLTVFKGAYTFPNGDSANKANYGLLYNNFAVDDSRGVCPAGWHVPSETEWAILSGYLGGIVPKEADTLYQDSNNGAGGEFGSIADKLSAGGSSGLNLNLGGQLYINPNQYLGFTLSGLYWGSSIAGFPSFVSAFGSVQNFWVAYGDGYLPANHVRYGFDNKRACSIRCVKD